MNSFKGFSYIEVLIATVLIAISLVPALEALKTGVQSSQAEHSYLSDHFHVLSKMEEVLKDPITTLDSAALAAGSLSDPTSYSDLAGTPSRRLVYLSRYDGDNGDGDNNSFTGTDEGLVWIKVVMESEAHSFESLASDY